MFVWFSIFHLRSGTFQFFGKFSTVEVEFFQLLVKFPLWVSGVFPTSVKFSTVGVEFFWFSKALLLDSSSKAWLGKE